MNSENQKDERHRKIGRNLVLLQKVELLLKDLIFKGNFTLRSNPTDTEFPSLKEQGEKQKAFLQKKTMGCLVTNFSKSALTSLTDSPSINDPNPKTSVLSLRLSSGETTEQQDRLKSQLEMITNGRNKLVHELLISFDLRTAAGLTDMDRFLEQQYKELLSVLDYLEGVRDCISIGAKIFFDSSYDARIPEHCSRVPCVTKMVACLCIFQYNKTHSDHFEWMSLASAKKDLNNLFPEAIPECRRYFKVKSLKKILREIGIFDVSRLPTNNEEEMVFYRMKPEYSLREKSGELLLCSSHQVESGGYLEETVSLRMFLED
jgi:hypothetical protein